MEKIKNAIRDNLLLVLGIVAAATILGGIVLIVLGLALASVMFYKVMFVMIAVLLELFGCVTLYFIFMLKDHEASSEEPNLFLYDPEREENMEPEVLNFDLVNDRMAFFMGRISHGVRELWTVNFFEKDEIFDGVEELKALLAYKMIYDLADRDVPALWEMYLSADESIVASLEDSLKANGDLLAEHVGKLHRGAVAKQSVEKSRKFYQDNRNYIRGRMLDTVRKNIEKF